jgi:hypothetical protein
LEEIADEKQWSMKRAALTYGELDLPTYGKDAQEISFMYCSQLGVMKKSDTQ